MGKAFSETIYLCPRCLEAQPSAGLCPNDGTELLSCRPGDPDDPCRRPLMDADGRVLTRAPAWWLHYTVEDLMKFLEEEVDR
ncbi:MAG: hypothetical protein GTO18_07040 [Anaerolineales bacterium]|nr:hypothetical protein [Anaerolineales bacterium]